MPTVYRESMTPAQRKEKMRELKQLQRQRDEEDTRTTLHGCMRMCYLAESQEDEQRKPEIVFVRGEIPAYLRGDNTKIVVVIPDELYRRFIRNVYLSACFYILICGSTWLIISILGINLRAKVPVPFYVWFIIAVFQFDMMMCYPKMQHIFPLNWILDFLYVFLLTLGGAYGMDLLSWKLLLIFQGGALVLIALLHLIGIHCPPTQGIFERLMSCLASIFLFASQILFFVLLFYSPPFLCLIFFVLLLTSQIILTPYNVQLIHGRLREITFFRTSYSALLICMEFTVCILSFGAFYLFYIYMETGVWPNWSYQG
ncbi:uncharacterized protein LOC122757296 [Drosophila mojavensis]|uniref:uncharacterized protein LOC122757296 n=1 Tax=Drosophila mojavensis TaxID=7230 RepID=UPI001CD139FB|nr:uncharacterized protein LOC122757296 [Drosophila mojavensis]